MQQALRNITIIDTTAPELLFRRLHGKCSDEHPMDDAATDNCGGSYHCEQVTTAGACAGDVITRTFTATDDCNAQALRRRSLIDTTAPELTIPSDYTAECSDEHPMDDATATVEVVITVKGLLPLALVLATT